MKGDEVDVPTSCQLSVFLIETNGELWQSTQYFNRLNGWTKITINLVGSGIGHPADHPKDFVVPTWATDEADIHTGHGGEQSVQLDLDKIERIGIEVITENEWACGESEHAPGVEFPDCSIMLDHIVRRR